MAAGWPAAGLAVVLLACAAPSPLPQWPPVDGGVFAGTDDAEPPRHPWCGIEGCECDEDDGRRQVSLRCAFFGKKNVTWKHARYVADKSRRANDSLVSVELIGDGLCSLNVSGRPFAASERLRSVHLSGFAAVTVGDHGLQVKNAANATFAVTVSRTGDVRLDANAIRPASGAVDVALTDCGRARLNSGVVSRLRSFVFRGIDSLELTSNAFRNAAELSVIDRVLLENLKADTLPSYAFQTTINRLEITDCAFGAIEGNAFPATAMENATFTNVTVGRVESNAFRSGLLVTDLRMTDCRVADMEENAVNSAVDSIHIERSWFGRVRSSAVSVANNLTLVGNTFQRLDGRAFVLKGLHSVRVDGNTFVNASPGAFYEEQRASEAREPSRSTLLVRDNEFRQPAALFRLQGPADGRPTVTGNRFAGRCGCGPWRLVADDYGGGGDAAMAGRNYCRLDATAAGCANLSRAGRDVLIAEFADAARCATNAADYESCASAAATRRAPDGEPGWERRVITVVVLLVMCGFAATCAVSAVMWLNARGYFIKLRTLLTSCNNNNGHNGGGTGDERVTTRSAYSLRPMPVHEYDEIRSRGAGKLVVIYQDQGTQTVPEELTYEMLQVLRERLDDPECYPEARGVIEDMYDRMVVERNCSGGGGRGDDGWYHRQSSGLDDMVSTSTTKAVAAAFDPDGRRNVASVGTGAPSLDKLWPPKMSAAYRHLRTRTAGDSAPSDSRARRRRPSVSDDYADPADMLDDVPAAPEGGDHDHDYDDNDDDDDADIYCELDDLREDAAVVGDDTSRPPPPPPVPRKPTEV